MLIFSVSSWGARLSVVGVKIGTISFGVFWAEISSERMEKAGRWRGSRPALITDCSHLGTFHQWVKKFYICSCFSPPLGNKHNSPQSLQLGDKGTGDRLPALKPIFQAQGPEQAKMTWSLTLLLSTPALQAEWQWLSRASETITFLLLLLLQHQHLLHRLGAPWSTEEEFLRMVEIDDFHPVRNWSTLSYIKKKGKHKVNRNILKWAKNFVTYPGADKLEFWRRLYRHFSENKAWALILLLLEQN